MHLHLKCLNGKEHCKYKDVSNAFLSSKKARLERMLGNVCMHIEVYITYLSSKKARLERMF